MMQIASPLLVLSLFLQTSPPAPKAAPPTAAQLTERVKKLQQDIESLRSALKYANRRVTALEGLNPTTVTLDASKPNVYFQIVTKSGTFLLALRDAEQYLDGYRLTLDIGNITSAKYTGFKLTATWAGPSPEDFDNEKGWETWTAKREKQTGEFSFVEVLPPGTWTRVRLNLSPATPSDVKEIEVEMETDTVGLTRPTER